MIHGLNNDFLYCAKKINVKFSDGKKEVSILGTGFFIKKDNKTIFVT